jgi:hypothetical protein
MVAQLVYGYHVDAGSDVLCRASLLPVQRVISPFLDHFGQGK